MRLEDARRKESARSLFLLLPGKEKKEFKSTPLLQSHDTVLWLITFTTGLFAISYTIWFYYTMGLFLFRTSHGDPEAYLLQIFFVLIIAKIYLKQRLFYYGYKWYAFLLNQDPDFFDEMGKPMFRSRYRQKLTMSYAEKFIDQYFTT